MRTILADLRKGLLSGRLAAGSRLPSVRDLAETYGVAGTTVHRCLQELTAAGFLSTHGRNGTRVVDHPPHRCRFGLVLPELPGADGTYVTRHWQAKAVAARAISTTPAQQVELFHGINGHPELPEHQALLQALDEQRLAGLIVVDEDRIRDWLVPARQRVPVVGVNVVAGKPAIGQLFLDQADFLNYALEAVAKRGLRRVAVCLDVNGVSQAATLQARAKALNLDLPLQRILCLPVTAVEWAPHVIASCFSGPVQDHPEALILGDEIGIPAVGAALNSRNIGPVFQVHIANLPLPALSKRPALRLGWDNRAYLLQAMALITAWHEHRQPIGNGSLPLIEASA